MRRLKTELAEGDMPVVFYDVGAPGKKSTNIRVQYRKGIEKIVQYLHNLGHTRMAFVGHHAKLAPLDERKKAFLETVARYSPHLEITSEADADGPEGGRKAARQLLASGFTPTAIICVNDFMAIGVLRELRDQGLRVPQDVSVTGFDNIKLSEFCFPALTTVHIPRERIGHSVFQESGSRMPMRPAEHEPRDSDRPGISGAGLYRCCAANPEARDYFAARHGFEPSRLKVWNSDN